MRWRSCWPSPMLAPGSRGSPSSRATWGSSEPWPTSARSSTSSTRIPSATPVFPGCGRSLLGSRVDATSHGADGLGDSHFPPSSRPVEAEHASLALVRLANEYPGELTLVRSDLSPTSALAISLDPHFPASIAAWSSWAALSGRPVTCRIRPRSSTFRAIPRPPPSCCSAGRAWPGALGDGHGLRGRHRASPRDLVRSRCPRSVRSDDHGSKAVARVRAVRRGRHVRRRPVAMAVAIQPAVVTRSEHRHVTRGAGRETHPRSDDRRLVQPRWRRA